MQKSKHLLTTALVLGIVMFITGVLVGYNINIQREIDVTNIIRSSELTTESYIIEQELIGNQDCDVTTSRVSDVADEIEEIGLLLNEPGAEAKLGQSTFNVLKRKYYVLQIKSYLFHKTLQENCKNSNHVILYYYSPDAQVDIGPELSEIAENKSARIFPVEFNFSPEIQFIESYYEITQTPAVVVDYENVLQGKFVKEDIINIIEESQENKSSEE